MQWLMTIVNSLLDLSALMMLILSLVLFIECLAAIFDQHKLVYNKNFDNLRCNILIPAHNEEIVIGATLESICQQLPSADSVVLIADNCSDRTADIARMAGVTVIERQDLENRGKGYALDYGLRFLADNPPDVVILIDADCQVNANYFDQLSQQAIALNRPAQSLNLLEQPETPTPKDAISAFAFKVKNWVRPQGLANLGLPCLTTMGTAFPWSVIRSVDLASGNIVEDMKLGLDLALAGYPPSFCPQVQVTGRLPQQQEAATTQRTRWEHGHLQTLITYVPRLLKGAISQKRLDLLIIALDLAIPPLSLFVSLWFALTLISSMAVLIGASWIAMGICAIAGLAILTAILTAWAKFGRKELPLSTLVAIPFYILWKIPLYFQFLWKRQSQWIRTQRD